ncbi:hypothetical protein ACP4OV_023403 [Aristida adscensionis]
MAVVPPEAHAGERRALGPHAVILLYNYCHRKQFPQLDFAGPKSFMSSRPPVVEMRDGRGKGSSTYGGMVAVQTDRVAGRGIAGSP